MKKWTRTILICMLLGVLSTIVVAWGFSLYYNPGFMRQQSGQPGDSVWKRKQSFYTGHLSRDLPTWRLSHRKYLGAERAIQTPVRTWLRNPPGDWQAEPVHRDDFPSWSAWERTAEPPGPEEETARWDMAYGWPMLSLRTVIETRPGTGAEGRFFIPVSREIQAWLSPHQPPADWYGLPLYPMMFGFVVNTFVYGGAWFVLIIGLRTHVRIVRKWQGYCPMCQYDLSGRRYHHAPRGAEVLRTEMDRRLAHTEIGGTSGESRPPSGCPECGWGRGDG